MKTVFGGHEIDRPVYADANPNSDRTPAPADAVAAYMAANLFYCQLLAARISARQCEVNRSKDLYSCGKCNHASLSQPVPKKRNTYGRTPLRRAMAPADQHAAPASPWRTQLYDRVALAEHEAAKASDECGKAETRPTQPKQVKAGQSRSKQVKAGQSRSGQVRSGQVRSGQRRRGLTRIPSKSCR